MGSLTQNQASKLPFLALADTPPFPLLTNAGDESGCVGSPVFYNQNISQIHIKLRAFSATAIPTTLRATLINYPNPADLTVQSVQGSCDILVPQVLVGNTSSVLNISMYSVTCLNANPTINPINGFTVTQSDLVGVVDLNGNVIPTIKNGSLITAQAIVYIPSNFRIILQNMGGGGNLTLSNLEFYFVN